MDFFANLCGGYSRKATHRENITSNRLSPNRKERYMKGPGNEKNPEEYAQTEDVVFKTAGEYFGKEALSFFRIPQKMRRVMPTEKIHLEVRRMYEDFNIEMENGEIYHFEFESDPIQKRDLRRFRQYEAVTGCLYQKDVVTYVICTAGARPTLSQFRTGINTYRVRTIRTNRRSADNLYRRLEKISPEDIGKDDLLAVAFSPLMNGKMPIKERIRRGFLYLDKKNRNVGDEERKKMQAMLYMLATKFLGRNELAEIKEEFSMTVLGQMLMDDGIQKGEGLFADLVDRLFRDGRMEEAGLAAKDTNVRKELYREYGLSKE